MIAQPEWNWAKSETLAMDMEGMYVTGVTGSSLNLGETEPAMLEIIETQIAPKLYKVTLTSTNGNVFGVAGPLYGEFNGDRWIPLTKACDAEL